MSSRLRLSHCFAGYFVTSLHTLASQGQCTMIGLPAACLLSSWCYRISSNTACWRHLRQPHHQVGHLCSSTHVFTLTTTGKQLFVDLQTSSPSLSCHLGATVRCTLPHHIGHWRKLTRPSVMCSVSPASAHPGQRISVRRSCADTAGAQVVHQVNVRLGELSACTSLILTTT